LKEIACQKPLQFISKAVFTANIFVKFMFRISAT